MGIAGVSKRMCPGFIKNAKAASGGRSMYDLYKFEVTPRFKDASSHSKQECLALSRIIDAGLRDDMDSVLELACRRLGGVHTGAETGNWDMCETLENEAEQRSFVPAEFMASALKSVCRMQRIKQAKAGVTSGNDSKSLWSGRSKRSSGFKSTGSGTSIKKKESSHKKDDSNRK